GVHQLRLDSPAAGGCLISASGENNLHDTFYKVCHPLMLRGRRPLPDWRFQETGFPLFFP
ncbi:MAG: hypothetical protein KJ726_11935, partial [Verrucomicrobia bacterium]|nr:hypothetical protein [Verrucomicrobiota bacterium]